MSIIQIHLDPTILGTVWCTRYARSRTAIIISDRIVHQPAFPNRTMGCNVLHVHLAACTVTPHSVWLTQLSQSRFILVYQKSTFRSLNASRRWWVHAVVLYGLEIWWIQGKEKRSLFILEKYEEEELIARSTITRHLRSTSQRPVSSYTLLFDSPSLS